MTKKSLLLGIASLVIGGTLLATQVSAYKGDPTIKGPNYTAQRHDQMEKAFDAGDYNAWKKTMGDQGGRVMQVINTQNFSQFAKAHQLAEQGKTAEANAIRAELGLGLQNGSGMGQGKGMGRNSR